MHSTIVQERPRMAFLTVALGSQRAGIVMWPSIEGTKTTSAQFEQKLIPPRSTPENLMVIP